MSNSDPPEVERGFRKLYWSFGLKVLAGVGVLALIDLLPLPSKWWAIPFLLVGGWLVLVNLSALSVLAMAQHRYRRGPEDATPLEQHDRTERQVHITSYVVLVIAMVAIILLSGLAENIVHKTPFLVGMGTAGVAVAALVLWMIKRLVPGYYQRNSEARAGAVLGLFFSIVVLVILGSAWVDRTSAEATARVQRYAVKYSGTNIKSGSNYVHLYRPGQRSEDFRIKVRGRELEVIAGRDSVDLLVGRGDLGVEHVLEVRP
jgi:hypothetical protein